MRNILLILAATGIAGCTEPALPGGYAFDASTMNREWLRGPDGTMVVPGLIKSLHREGERILLVAHAASAGGNPIPPTPIDDTCFIALSIDTAERSTTQITLAEASRMARDMAEVFSTDRGCH